MKGEAFVQPKVVVASQRASSGSIFHTDACHVTDQCRFSSRGAQRTTLILLSPHPVPISHQLIRNWKKLNKLP